MSVLITYWSMTGNTKIMAEAIFEGVKTINEDVTIKSVDEINPREINKFEKILFGSPAMGFEELDQDFYIPWYEIAEKSLTNQLIGLFGSFGWGDGEWLKKWEKRIRKNKLNLFEKSLKVNTVYIEECYQECFNFGVLFAKK